MHEARNLPPSPQGGGGDMPDMPEDKLTFWGWFAVVVFLTATLPAVAHVLYFIGRWSWNLIG